MTFAEAAEQEARAWAKFYADLLKERYPELDFLKPLGVACGVCGALRAPTHKHIGPTPKIPAKGCAILARQSDKQRLCDNATQAFAAIIAEDFNDEPTFTEKVQGVLNLAIHYAGNYDKHGLVRRRMYVYLDSFTEMCEFVCMLPKPIEITVSGEVDLEALIDWEHTTVGGRTYTISLSVWCPL